MKNNEVLQTLQDLYFRLEARMEKLETKADADRKFDLIVQTLKGIRAKLDDIPIGRKAIEDAHENKTIILKTINKGE